MLTITSLQQQLKLLEQELEMAKAHLYRTDGAIQIVKHQIEAAEKEPVPKDDQDN